MSPVLLRRYRAERLLHQEFEGLRKRVLGVVRGRLRARGVELDGADLEACYAEAWQGLYASLLAGEEIANRAGWLVLVTYRRALDQHRSRGHEDYGAGEGGAGATAGPAPERLDEWQAPPRDLAAELDDRARLRQVLEGLRARLSTRECQAASLCYLQGLSRAEAAAQMGISEARMRKLMEGSAGKGSGVAAKVGELLETIRAGGWCEQQASLMRGFAFGILDPEGERYRLAQLHQRACPACRAYVLSLRGLAAVLPPTALPWGLGAGALAGASAGAGVGGVTGGGWLLAGTPVGAKLAVGCALALGVGAGCVALSDGHPHNHVRAPHRQVLASAPDSRAAQSSDLSYANYPLHGGQVGSATRAATTRALAAALNSSPEQKARREFSLERGATAGKVPRRQTARARVARSSSLMLPPARSTRQVPARGSGAAAREFGLG